VEALKEEPESLRRCRSKVFQVPPLEWIQERLTKLKDILERNSERSGLLLRKLLGPLRLEPTSAGDNDRPFYKATTSLNTLALVDPLIEGEGREGGSNSLQWWSRWDCVSALEENRRKTARFQSLLPLTDFPNVP